MADLGDGVRGAINSFRGKHVFVEWPPYTPVAFCCQELFKALEASRGIVNRV